jgi:hypothetical protein
LPIESPGIGNAVLGIRCISFQRSE